MSPVPEKFQAYGEAVCAFLSHATRREKAAVRQELMDHLTDHTQALLDAGCPPEAAETRALAAMGEAQEVGQALNQAFPRRWLVLSRLALAALGLLLTMVLSYVLPLGDHLQEAWAIRQDPLHNYHTTFLLGEGHTLENVTPLEGQSYPLPAGELSPARWLYPGLLRRLPLGTGGRHPVHPPAGSAVPRFPLDARLPHPADPHASRTEGHSLGPLPPRVLRRLRRL